MEVDGILYEMAPVGPEIPPPSRLAPTAPLAVSSGSSMLAGLSEHEAAIRFRWIPQAVWPIPPDPATASALQKSVSFEHKSFPPVSPRVEQPAAVEVTGRETQSEDAASSRHLFAGLEADQNHSRQGQGSKELFEVLDSPLRRRDGAVRDCDAFSFAGSLADVDAEWKSSAFPGSPPPKQAARFHASFEQEEAQTPKQVVAEEQTVPRFTPAETPDRRPSDLLPGETPKQAVLRRKREVADREMARMAEVTAHHVAQQPVKPRTVCDISITEGTEADRTLAADDGPWAVKAVAKPQRGFTHARRATVGSTMDMTSKLPNGSTHSVGRWTSDGGSAKAAFASEAPSSPRRDVLETQVDAHQPPHEAPGHPIPQASLEPVVQGRSSAPSLPVAASASMQQQSALAGQQALLTWGTADLPGETPREAARRRKCEAADRDMLQLKQKQAEVAGAASQVAKQLRDSQMHTFKTPFADASCETDNGPLQELPGSSVLTFK